MLPSWLTLEKPAFLSSMDSLVSHLFDEFIKHYDFIVNLLLLAFSVR